MELNRKKFCCTVFILHCRCTAHIYAMNLLGLGTFCIVKSFLENYYYFSKPTLWQPAKLYRACFSISYHAPPVYISEQGQPLQSYVGLYRKFTITKVTEECTSIDYLHELYTLNSFLGSKGLKNHTEGCVRFVNI